MGLIIRDHVDLKGVTQNLMSFEKEETNNEMNNKLNNMDVIEAYSCEGLSL